MGEKKEKSGKLGTIANIVLCIILLPIIAINIAVIASTYLYPDELPGVFGFKPVAVLSGSMEDTLMTGDLILIKSTVSDSLKEGDVICYLVTGQAVTHRISRVEKDDSGNIIYVTKGDANDTEDQEVVTPEQVQGIWTGARMAGGGNFVVFLSSTTGMILFIVCPILLYIIWDMVRRWRLDKKEKNRTAELEAELKALKEQKKEET